MDEPVTRLAGFGAALREAGVPASPAQLIDLCTAAALLSPADLYWAGRATVAPGEDLIAIYDCVFADFFGGLPTDGPEPAPEPAAAHEDDDEQAGEDDDAQGVSVDAELASPLEVLHRAPFEALDEQERARLRGTRPVAPRRPSHRTRVARRGGLDVSRTLHRALKLGGEPIELVHRRNKTRPRRIVMLIDVSRSMREHARRWLLAGHVAARAGRHVEVFAFGTRLTRLTHELRLPNGDRALERTAERLVDRDAGTRIGDSLRVFIDEYGRRGLARGALVVICSDGLETGDPVVLAEQMARLRRLAWKIVWLNPLAADAEFEPLTRGMQAALPFIDHLESGEDFSSFDLIGASA